MGNRDHEWAYRLTYKINQRSPKGYFLDLSPLRTSPCNPQLKSISHFMTAKMKGKN